VFRFWAYKRFVFLHPDRVARGLPDETPAEAAGLVPNAEPAQAAAADDRPASADPIDPEDDRVVRAS